MLTFTGLSLCAFLFYFLAGRTETALLSTAFLTSSLGLYIFAHWHLFSDLPLYISIPLALLKIIGVISGIQLCMWCMKQTSARQDAKHSFKIFLVIYLGVLAVALATDFQGKHAAIAAPLLFSFFLLLVRSITNNTHEISMHCHRNRWIIRFLCFALVYSGFQTLTLNGGRGVISLEKVQAKNGAEMLDHILDDCQISRYFFLNFESEPIYAYTKHSPLNFFLYATMSRLNNWGLTLQEITWDRFRSADIIIATSTSMKLPDFDPGVWEFVQQEFSRVPWPCANGVNTAGGYDLFFRERR